MTAPSLGGISPNVGPASGGGLVRITGADFADQVAVYFGDDPATVLNVHHDAGLDIADVHSPAHAQGRVNVTLQNLDPSGSPVPGEAYAEVSDLTGMDARARGMGMTTLTLCEDYTAAVCNPAAGAMASRISVGFGFGYSFTRADLTVNGVANEELDIRGIPFGFNAPFKVYKQMRAAVSLMAYMPDQFLARVQLVPAYEPRFVLLDNA